MNIQEEDYLVPVQAINNKDASTSFSTSPKGVSIEITKPYFKLGFVWDGKNVDFDLSAIIYPSCTRYSWNSRYTGSITYSGDNRGMYERNNQESMTFKVADIWEEYIFFSVNSFTSHPFVKQNCRVGIAQGDEPGRVKNSSLEFSSAVENQGKGNVLGVFHVPTKRFMILDLALKDRSIIADSDIHGLVTLVQRYMSTGTKEIPGRLNVGHVIEWISEGHSPNGITIDQKKLLNIIQ